MKMDEINKLFFVQLISFHVRINRGSIYFYVLYVYVFEIKSTSFCQLSEFQIGYYIAMNVIVDGKCARIISVCEFIYRFNDLMYGCSNKAYIYIHLLVAHSKLVLVLLKIVF